MPFSRVLQKSQSEIDINMNSSQMSVSVSVSVSVYLWVTLGKITSAITTILNINIRTKALIVIFAMVFTTFHTLN